MIHAEPAASPFVYRRMDSERHKHFADFRFDLTTLELTRSGRPIDLERQPALVLARLLTDAGHLVTRRQLREAVWPADVHVDFDRNLNYCLRQIRAALGDDGRAPRFIHTVPRQGYRFTAPVVATAGRRSRPRLVRLSLAAAGLIAITALVELSPSSRHHHAIAVHVVRTIHNWVF